MDMGMTKNNISDAVRAKHEIATGANASESVRRRWRLLAANITVIVIQLTTLILLPVLYPANDSFLWFVLLFFLILTLILSVLASIVSQQNVELIIGQANQLVESGMTSGEMSIRDPLTNLFSRAYLEQTLERELQRSLRDHTAVGIIIVDIDKFKDFNDTYGHAVGDMMLKKLGEYLQEGIRASDIACRYGGEEFALIITEASRDLTLERAEHLRKEASQIKLDYEGQNIRGITISIGAAIYPDHGLTVDALLEKAELALQQAKADGRNQVFLYQKGVE